MNLMLLRPWALLLLVLLGILWFAHRRSITPLRGWRKSASVAVRSVVVVLLVLALAEPRWFGVTEDEQVILMVDLSRSMGEEALEAADSFAAAANFNEAEVHWMGFGGVGRITPDLEKLREVHRKDLKPDQTRLDLAFGLAAAGFRSDRVRTAVLFSDGNATAGKMNPAHLAEQGIRVHVVPVQPTERAEVLVREVTAPQRVREEEPLSVSAIIQSTVEGRAGIDFFRNGVRIDTWRSI